ncbi:hypothetical protein RintRC_1894 [Richelia intracellularis]|nr:hypothetical protein RintRC_1894 [Richelia intracellularis]
MANQVFEAQIFVNAFTVSYFFLLFALNPKQRLMGIIFVPFSVVGEYVFSLILEMYHYRLGGVPMYVPFGHAILFSVGVLY